jgi:hypothetical protein
MRQSEVVKKCEEMLARCEIQNDANNIIAMANESISII